VHFTWGSALAGAISLWAPTPSYLTVQCGREGPPTWGNSGKSFL
jgi:hypothetical protein